MTCLLTYIMTVGAALASSPWKWVHLLAGLVVSLRRLQLLNVSRRQLRPVDGQRDFAELAGDSAAVRQFTSFA